MARRYERSRRFARGVLRTAQLNGAADAPALDFTAAAPEPLTPTEARRSRYAPDKASGAHVPPTQHGEVGGRGVSRRNKAQPERRHRHTGPKASTPPTIEHPHAYAGEPFAAGRTVPRPEAAQDRPTNVCASER